jgi:spore coat polysaccharide biosynthesis protein SpsF (cytidylyltransferase family)
MLDRLKLANNVDEIIICTSIEDQDRPLGGLAKENNVKCFFGNPDDVLTRLLGAADEFNLDYILNITADCPFVDPFYADKIVEEYLETDADLIRQFDLPHGVFSYGIKVEALRKVVELKDSSDTEVWGKYFTDTRLFNVVDLNVNDKHHNRPGLRMTLDYPEDFEFSPDRPFHAENYRCRERTGLPDGRLRSPAFA